MNNVRERAIINHMTAANDPATRYAYVVVIETDTKAHADRVIMERLDYEETYYEDSLGIPTDESVNRDATTFAYAISYSELNA